MYKVFTLVIFLLCNFNITSAESPNINKFMRFLKHENYNWAYLLLITNDKFFPESHDLDLTFFYLKGAPLSIHISMIDKILLKTEGTYEMLSILFHVCQGDIELLKAYLKHEKAKIYIRRNFLPQFMDNLEPISDEKKKLLLDAGFAKEHL